MMKDWTTDDRSPHETMDVYEQAKAGHREVIESCASVVGGSRYTDYK